VAQSWSLEAADVTTVNNNSENIILHPLTLETSTDTQETIPFALMILLETSQKSCY